MDMLSYPYVRPFGVASRSRNGAFIPMTPFLLASILSCSDAEILIETFNGSDVPQEHKVELVEVVKTNTEAECWDAND